MSGVLDNKSRVFDVFLTQTGRRELVNGGVDVRYVSFSDAVVVYDSDANIGVTDPTSRVCFEASNLPCDRIMVSSADENNVSSQADMPGTCVINGQLVSTSLDSSGSLVNNVEQMSLMSDELLLSSLRSFENLRVLSTTNDTVDDGSFGLGPTSVEFVIGDKKPLNSANFSQVLSDMDGVMTDPRMTDVINFKYLPPVTKGSKHLGSYPVVAPSKALTSDAIVQEVEKARRRGFVQTLSIDPTSDTNNVAIQIFEQQGDKTLKKLDVVPSKNNTFFVGKTYIDDNDVHTFVHLMTLVIHAGS